jgi:hypothetical protein
MGSFEGEKTSVWPWTEISAEKHIRGRTFIKLLKIVTVDFLQNIYLSIVLLKGTDSRKS